MVAPSINTLKPTPTIKFLCSYGGWILPRYPDGKLRYHGGETRVLSIHRSSISYAELVGKLVEMCGTSSTSLRCQLPMEDLDALVSITSDEDLANLIEEYDRAAAAMAALPTSIKIRAFLCTPKTTKKVSSPPPSTASSFSSSSSNEATSPTSFYSTVTAAASRRPTSNTRPSNTTRYVSRPPVYPPCKGVSAAGKLPKQAYYRHVHVNNNGHVYLIHNGNHWQ